jgi:hypothetical protein
MQIRQISIYLENKPGQLSAICRVLADADINIAALSLADTSDFGLLRMIVDDHEKAKDVLSSCGYPVVVREVVAVLVPDTPGGMSKVLCAIDEAQVDVEYSYAFAFHRGEKAVLVFSFKDADAAAKALAKAGCITLAENELKEIEK